MCHCGKVYRLVTALYDYTLDAYYVIFQVHFYENKNKMKCIRFNTVPKI